MNMAIKKDRRVKYTKMVLKQSLLQLMQEQSIQKITVTDICKSADINRNTFYSHYSSPEDLLNTIENELFKEIIVSLDASNEARTVTLKICQSILDNQELCKIIFSENGDRKFMKRVTTIAHDKYITQWKAMAKHHSTDLLEKTYIFTENGTTALIQNWIRNGFVESPEKIASFIDEINKVVLDTLS